MQIEQQSGFILSSRGYDTSNSPILLLSTVFTIQVSELLLVSMEGGGMGKEKLGEDE